MIAKMKKYMFLTYYKDHNIFLKKLRDLGVVHIVEKQTGEIFEDSELYNWMNYGKRLKDTIRSLKSVKEEYKIEDLNPVDKNIDGIKRLEEIEEIFSEKERLIHKKNAIEKEFEKIYPWGDFDLKDLEKLQNSGVYIHFHTISESKFNENWIEEYNAIKINKANSLLYFVTITDRSEFPDIDTEHIKSFESSVSNIEKELQDIEKKTNDLIEKLKIIVKEDLNTLLYTEKEITDNINWEKALLYSEEYAENKVILLEGYVPKEKEENVNSVLSEEDVYFEASEIAPEENPPILLKNNKFAGLFEVISNLYDRPSYHGFDLTPFYAPFYIIFFGLCVGDCGYGLLYILISFILGRSKNTFLKSISKLVFWLGIGTIIFGFISGTFFGISLLDQTWPWLQRFKGIIMDSNQMFYFALILGVIQLTFAWVIKIVTTTMRFGFVYALDTLGWVIVLWGNVLVYLLASNGIIPANLQGPLHYTVSIIGAAFMLFFNKPEKGIKGVAASIGSGLWGLYNKITGLLGDILSYIRLFALGISGAVLGLVFNQLAFSFAPDIIILKQLVVVLILLFGHAVNLFLCSLSAFVHPMRLTFVEFYNNAGFEGGGKKYEPFKRNIDIE